MVGGIAFPFVSGGAGAPIPFGSYEITPNELGAWGRRHGALGLNHNDPIPDPKLGRERWGIEIHRSHGATEGCVGIEERFEEFKRRVLAMIREAGSAWLHVTGDGAEITPTR